MGGCGAQNPAEATGNQLAIYSSLALQGPTAKVSQEIVNGERLALSQAGRRGFGRLQPGDPVQAAAQVKLMQALGVSKVYVLDDQNPFVVPLAELVAADAHRAGIGVAAHDSLPIALGGVFQGEVGKVTKSGAQAIFFAGGGSAGAISLWRALHRAKPSLLLLGSNALATEAFTAAIGPAGGRTYLTSPELAVQDYPQPAPSGCARQQPPGRDRPLLRRQGSRLGAGPLLDPPQRRNHLVGLRGVSRAGRAPRPLSLLRRRLAASRARCACGRARRPPSRLRAGRRRCAGAGRRRRGCDCRRRPRRSHAGR